MNKDKESLIKYAKSHLSDLIPYDDPEYESKLQKIAEAYADIEINGIEVEDDELYIDDFDISDLII